jgi:hypothetical protein
MLSVVELGIEEEAKSNGWLHFPVLRRAFFLHSETELKLHYQKVSEAFKEALVYIALISSAS